MMIERSTHHLLSFKVRVGLKQSLHKIQTSITRSQKVTNPMRVSNAYIHMIERWFITKEWGAIYGKNTTTMRASCNGRKSLLNGKIPSLKVISNGKYDGLIPLLETS